MRQGKRLLNTAMADGAKPLLATHLRPESDSATRRGSRLGPTPIRENWRGGSKQIASPSRRGGLGLRPLGLGVSIVCMLVGLGCTASPWASKKAALSAGSATPGTSAVASTNPTVESAPAARNDAALSGSSDAAARQMTEVLDELKQIGGLEPADYDQLIRDMQKTDPTLWPLLVQQVRATVAYRQRYSGGTGGGSLWADSGDSPRRGEAAALTNVASGGEGRAIEAGLSAPMPPRSGPQRLPPVDQTAAAPGADQTMGPIGRNPASGRPLTPAKALDDRERWDDAPRSHGTEHEARRLPPPDPRRAAVQHDPDVRHAGYQEETDEEEPRRSGRSAGEDRLPTEKVSGNSVGARLLSSERDHRSSPLRPTSDEAEVCEDQAETGRRPERRLDRAVARTAAAEDKDQGSERPLADEARFTDWREALTAAIAALEGRKATGSADEEELTRLARLKMLYLALGRRDAALRPSNAISPEQHDVISRMLYGWDVWLDAKRTPDGSVRAAEAKKALEEAAARLAESAPLVVRNLAFCTEILSYGCYKPFKSTEFAPDQEVLLYVEVENFTSEPTPRGYHTALRSSYRIFDPRGQQVAEHDFTTTEEYCQNQRRDFFIGYHLRIPKRIYPGKYTLQLTVEDLKSRKAGQSQIDFSVKELSSGR